MPGGSESLRSPASDLRRKKAVTHPLSASRKRHSSAVNDVLRVRGKASKEEYDRARARVDEARNSRNAARLVLEQHKKEHHC